MLVLDDEPQRGVELVDALEAGGRPAQAAFEALPFVAGERREQLLFRGEPAVQRRPGYPGLGGDVGQAEFASCRFGRAPRRWPRGSAAASRCRLRWSASAPYRNFTKFARSVTLFSCHCHVFWPGSLRPRTEVADHQILAGQASTLRPIGARREPNPGRWSSPKPHRPSHLRRRRGWPSAGIWC